MCRSKNEKDGTKNALFGGHLGANLGAPEHGSTGARCSETYNAPPANRRKARRGNTGADRSEEKAIRKRISQGYPLRDGQPQRPDAQREAEPEGATAATPS